LVVQGSFEKWFKVFNPEKEKKGTHLNFGENNYFIGAEWDLVFL
jgi:hypothetical protein